jgi:ABC-2 type transport system permease protein
MMFGYNTWVVFMYELRQTFLKRGFLFSLFGIPLLGLALFLFVSRSTGGGDATSSLDDIEFDLQGIEVAGYVDHTGEFLDAGELAREITIRYETFDDAEQALKADEVDVVLVIPEGYFEDGVIEFYAPTFSFMLVTDEPMRQLFYSQLLERGLEMETLVRMATPLGYNSTKLQEIVDEELNTLDEQTRSERAGAANVMSILMIFTLFSTSTYLMQTVIEEKSSRLAELLLAYVRPGQLLTGKILAMFVLGLLITLVYGITVFVAIQMTSGSTTILSGIKFAPDMLVLFIAYYLIGYLLYAALFGAIGAISTNLNEGSGVMSVILILVMLPIFFATEIMEAPNGLAAVGFSMFPLTSPIGMIMRTAVVDVPIIQYVISLGLLIVTTFTLLWLAGRLFRFQNMVSGRMPKLSEIPALIFGPE